LTLSGALHALGLEGRTLEAAGLREEYGMSQENVELLRRAYEAFNEGDPSVFLEHYDPEILLWVSPGHSLESGCFVGASAVERCFTEFIAAFGGSFRVEAEEFIDVGDSVIVLTTERAQGRRSGAEVSSRQHPIIYTCVRARSFASMSMPDVQTPSKPWGCRSSRCRRRTWRSCAGSSPGGRWGISSPAPRRLTSTWSSSSVPTCRSGGCSRVRMGSGSTCGALLEQWERHTVEA
jgi:ketosteroid isomerase-like protein